MKLPAASHSYFPDHHRTVRWRFSRACCRKPSSTKPLRKCAHCMLSRAHEYPSSQIIKILTAFRWWFAFRYPFNISVLFNFAAVTQVRCSHGVEESAEQFDDRYESFFNRQDVDGWDIRKAMNDLQVYPSLLSLLRSIR